MPDWNNAYLLWPESIFMSVLNNIYVFSGFFCYVTMIYKRSFPSTLNSRDAEFFFSENIYFSRTQFCKKLKV